MLPARVFNDADIHELEKERIFSRTWMFLAHESEIAKPGDYVQRYIADDSFIVARDETMAIRVLFNACRHRGTLLCRAEMGNAPYFRCSYHGWTYKNTGELLSVPHHQEIYGACGLDKGKWGLLAAPRVETYSGWIFANLDPDAPSLEKYLGGLKWYLEFYTKKSDAGLEVIGAPQRWVVHANWKLAAANFISDGYHTSTTHQSVVETGQVPGGRADFLLDGVQVNAGAGGIGFRRLPPGSAAGRGFPQHMLDALQRHAPEQLRLIEQGLFPSHGSVFPNLSFLGAAAVLKPDTPPVPYFTLRVWQPVGPDQTEIWSWLLIEQGAPEALKAASRKSYVISFGTGGTLEQDDTENWTTITRASRGRMARQNYLNLQMGMDFLQPISDWPGPGKAYPLDYAEANERFFYWTWIRYMSDGA